MMNLKGLATGIGSLPFTDPQIALDLILRYVPSAPFWPQLPKSNPREGMLAQFSENLPGLKFKDGDLYFVSQDKEKALELFYDRLIAWDLDYFKISPDFSRGLPAFYQRLDGMDLTGVEFIKCQVTGPFTFCAGVKDTEGKIILHDEVLRQAMVKGLAMKALWQLEYFKKFGKKMIIFFDEPYLTGVGSAYTTVNRKDVMEIYSELADTLKSQGSLIGVHCCGNTDWSMLTDTSGIDVINFDAFNFQERFVLYADNLDRFLKKGGIICWGIVPTQEFNLNQSPELLAQKIRTGLEILVKKGINRQLLLERLLISPACGLGTLDAQKAEGILNLLNQTSLFIRKNL
jgi:methionine synthase II (cobalamin-independent)